LELDEKCNKAGKEYVREFQSGWRDPQYIWDEPEYHYNKRLNACLVHIRFIESDKYDIASSRHHNQVVNVFSNKTILRGWFRRDVKEKKESTIDLGDDVPNYTSIEYFKQKNKLFSE
jgi:hypothetical protein